MKHTSAKRAQAIRAGALATAAAVSMSLLGSVQTAYNVTGVVAAPNPFSVGGTTTVSYNLNQAALLWMKVYDAGNTLRRNLVTPASFTATNRSAGANSVVWDGKDNTGTALPAGFYSYTIDDVFFSAHLILGQINPHDIAPVPTTPGTLWVTAKTSPYLFKSTNGGASWTSVSGSGANAKDYGIVVSNDGQKIFIANDGLSGLIVSSNGGSTWTKTASFPASSTTITDVAISANGSIAYVLDYGKRLIYRSANGGSTWTTCGASGLTLTTSTSGVATDATGAMVIVTDSSGDRLFKSNNNCASFSPIATITSGTGAGQVRFPYQVAIENDGKFWVSESTNHRIQQFDANGKSLMVVGGPTLGTGNLQFDSGAKYFGIGLATISGQPYIFVADYNNMRIKKLGYDNWTSTTPLQIGSGGGTTTNPNQTTAGATSAVALGGTGITVSMPYNDDLNGGNTYKVEYKLATATAWTIWAANAAHIASPYTTAITGLTPGTTYDVRMTYVDLDGVNGTNPQTVRLTLPACDAIKQPFGLTAIDTPADNGESISLSWTPSASTCVVEQRIYRSMNGGSSFILLDIIPGNTINTYLDYSADLGVDYSYRVRAFDGIAESGDSNTAGAKALDDTAPAAPISLAAAPSNGKVFLSWGSSSSWDVIEQRVYRRESTTGGYSLIATLGSADTDYIDTTVSNGKTYYYVLTAFDGTNASPNSIEANASPASNRIDPPTRLSAMAGDTKVQLAWTLSGSTGITEQRIYRSTTSGTGYVKVGTASASAASYADTSVVNGTLYFYVVRAFNGTAESGNTNEERATPIANLAPVAQNGALSVLKDGTANGVLTASDLNGDALTFALAVNGVKGTATITNSATGTYRYVPKAGMTGTDTFTFQASDGRLLSNIATITVTIGTTVANTTLNAGWNLVSIPTSLSPTNDLKSLLSDDVGSTPEVYAWPSYGIAGSFDGFYEPATTAQPGKAYWLVIYKDATVIDDQFNGENTTQCDPVSFPGVQCVDIALQVGGNLIGNPYTVTKDLLQASQVKVCDSTATKGCKLATDWKTFAEAVTSGWLLNTVYSYNPATKTYEYTQSIADGAMKLAPWGGWWLRVETNNQLKLRFYK